MRYSKRPDVQADTNKANAKTIQLLLIFTGVIPVYMTPASQASLEWSLLAYNCAAMLKGVTEIKSLVHALVTTAILWQYATFDAK